MQKSTNWLTILLEGCLVLLAPLAVKDESDAAANKDNKARDTLHGVLIVSAFSKGFSGGKVESKMVRNITWMSNKYITNFRPPVPVSFLKFSQSC